MKTIITRTYQCEICGERSRSKDAIEQCEKRGREPRHDAVAVGDIVTARAGFGWFDGDQSWIANFDKIGKKDHPFAKPVGNESHGNCFDSCCTYQFFYVVTAIEEHGHTLRYHLATKAMSEKSGYHIGWTRVSTHYTIKRVEHPPALDTHDLIGKLAPRPM